MIKDEKYHIFKRGDKICLYGIFGLTREYYKSGAVPASSTRKKINIEIPHPKTKVMQINVTSACNLKCEYCSFKANAPAKMGKKLTDEEIGHWISLFNRDIGDDGLMIIAGGEPELERKTVNSLIEKTGGKKIIFTNGTLLDKNRLEYYRDNDIGIIFSLDGDELTHESKRKGDSGSYKKLEKALLTAKEIGFEFGISTVVGYHNVAKLPEIVEYFNEKYCPASIGLNLPHKAGGELWRGETEYTEAMLKIFRYAKPEGLFIDQINRRLTPLLKQKFRVRDCAAQENKIVVFPGMITTNCVNQAGLENGDFDWSMRIPLYDKMCEDCFGIGICGGGCLFDGAGNSKDGNFDVRNCYFTKNLLEFMIWDLYDELGENSNNFTEIMKIYGEMIVRDKKYKLSVGHEYA